MNAAMVLACSDVALDAAVKLRERCKAQCLPIATVGCFLTISIAREMAKADGEAAELFFAALSAHQKAPAPESGERLGQALEALHAAAEAQHTAKG